MYADYSSSINVEEKRNEGKNMIKKEKIVKVLQKESLKAN